MQTVAHRHSPYKPDSGDSTEDRANDTYKAKDRAVSLTQPQISGRKSRRVYYLGRFRDFIPPPPIR